MRRAHAQGELSEGAIELVGVPTLLEAVFRSSSSDTRAARSGLPPGHELRRLGGLTWPDAFRLSIGGISLALKLEARHAPGCKRIAYE
jgi:hypothetical protein